MSEHLKGQDTVEMPPLPNAEELVARYFGSRLPALLRPEFAALSHPGKVRANNEDHYAVVRRRRSRDVLLTNLPEGTLRTACEEAYSMVVADGVGGAAYGELASMLALQAGWDCATRAFKWHFKITEAEANDLTEHLRAYGHLMQQALCEQARLDPRLAGMATTITGALVIGCDAFIGHAGDSRAYLFRKGSLWQLTHDDTQAQQLVEAGIFPSVAAAPPFLRHLLTNCLSASRREARVEVCHAALADGDRLLLCTDGLTDLVRDDEIARILDYYPVPAEACQALVDAALANGGRDNVTVVLAALTLGP
jgi:PPM family protein phosphatase